MPQAADFSCGDDDRISVSSYEPPLDPKGTFDSPEAAKDGVTPFPPRDAMHTNSQRSDETRFDYVEGNALRGVVVVVRSGSGGWYVGAEWWCNSVLDRFAQS